MELTEILELLKSVDKPGGIQIDAPLTLAVTVSDGRAARLLEWLMAELGDSGTLGDALDVLSSAEWWLVFLSSQRKAKRRLLAQGQQQ